MVSAQQSMTYNPKINIQLRLCAAAAALALLTFPAAAQSPSAAQARQWCFGSAGITDGQRLAGCSAVLQGQSVERAALANRGEIFRRKGETERALADLNRAIDLDQTDATAWYNRGITYDDLGDRDHAIADYTRAIRLEARRRALL